jgi:hypothetical protein
MFPHYLCTSLQTDPLKKFFTMLGLCNTIVNLVHGNRVIPPDKENDRGASSPWSLTCTPLQVGWSCPFCAMYVSMKALWTPPGPSIFPSPADEISKSKSWREKSFVLLTTCACTLTSLPASSEITASAHFSPPSAMNEQLNPQKI